MALKAGLLTCRRRSSKLAAFGPADAGESGMRVQDLIGQANQVVARLRVVGKHTGTHPRMPEPTSRDCDVEQIWIFTMTNGVTHRPPQWRRDVFKPIQ
ncbi:MAG TPA: hypothetical protein VN969_41950 [Streptosporangiaceae bacterium]|jgi:hypothetical protein|nr:hypothetical protein [Streptosporangiaceae bacterium]